MLKAIFKNLLNSILPLSLLVFAISCTSSNTNQHQIKNQLSVEEYEQAVYASWLGQIVGNTYGLCYEFHFIDEPGPDNFPYGYTWTLDEVKKHNGAFSDDDTDIEYMYLLQMEKYGIEPTYYQLAEAWKSHVKTRVWCANRAALALMRAGHYPPVTGSADFNPQWMQIDPQLVNEIWAVTAPGMIQYAVDKSEYTARITNDRFGIEPTLHYAAMYSAAFFEKDINKLIDIGTAALPENSRFSQVVEHVKQLHHDHPDDWQTSRKIVKDKYHVYADYNKYAWPPIDAILNGAYGIMALLYGQGDFQKTLDYSCAFGMDADNQAATMCGLLGIVHGLEGIPTDLLYPVKDAGWELPFNDFYKMVTREGLSDATITDMAKRIAAQGEKIILANGGKIITQNDQKFYQINEQASYTDPFELSPFPDFYVQSGNLFSYPIYTGGDAESISLSISDNSPPGIVISNFQLTGTPNEPGIYQFQIIASNGKLEYNQWVNFQVHGHNLAGDAKEVLFNKSAMDHNIEIIRDGKVDQTYYSIKNDDQREIDFYGYSWDEAQTISSLSYNNGVPTEFCGWFTTFGVEYLVDDEWVAIDNISVSPELDLDNSQWAKGNFIDYEIQFDPVVTTGIRIIGLSGGIEKDAGNAHLGLQYYTPISELRVFGD